MIHIVEDGRITESRADSGSFDEQKVLKELLAHIGFACRVWDVREWKDARPSGLTVVAGASDEPQWRETCRSHLADGNNMLAIGGTYGLKECLGVVEKKRFREGYVKWGGNDALGKQLGSSFHFFGGVGLASVGEGARKEGKMAVYPGMESEFPAFVSRNAGKGTAACFAPNLMLTWLLISQGVPVLKDGHPSNDGTAQIRDRTLKADDGCVLDWETDRRAVHPHTPPMFLDPILDEFRIVLVRILADLQAGTGVPLAWKWFWPGGIPSIGHISHDTDSNLEDNADNMLDVLDEAGIRSTWCNLAPGYRDRGMYAKIREKGHEIGFHYDAMAETDGAWSRGQFMTQLQFMKEAAGEPDMATNKNHFLRWEQYDQFYAWCAEAGIRVEQSKGGTKQGNKGFTFGTCHPYRPFSPDANEREPYPVYSLPTLAWDPPMPLRCTREEARALLNKVHQVNGVAHFLIHPRHVLPNPEEARAIVELVNDGRAEGMAWKTSRDIADWLDRRMEIQVWADRNGNNACLHVVSGRIVDDLSIMLYDTRRIRAANHPALRNVRESNRFGLSCTELIVSVDTPGKEIRLELAY